MKNLLLLLSLSVVLTGCKLDEATDTTIRMGKVTDDMAVETKHMDALTTDMADTTNRAMHQQTLGAGLTAMEADTDILTPPSLSMMLGAITFAQEARTDENHRWVDGADEVMDYIDGVLTLIDSQPQPDSSAKACPGFKDPETNCPESQQSLANLVNRFNHQQHKRVVQLEAVAGQIAQSTPDPAGSPKAATVLKILQAQRNGGLREARLNQFFMLRALFINDISLQQGYFKSKIKNMSQLQTATNYLNQLQFIAELPFVRDIQLKITNVYQADGSAVKAEDPAKPLEYIDSSFDLQMVADRWNDLSNQINKYLVPANSEEANRAKAISATAARYGAINSARSLWAQYLSALETLSYSTGGKSLVKPIGDAKKTGEANFSVTNADKAAELAKQLVTAIDSLPDSIRHADDATTETFDDIRDQADSF